jgi:hypothetical protein
VSDATTIEAIIRQIGLLRTRYAPRPTPWDNLSDDDIAEMSEEWVRALLPFGPATMMDAIDQWIAEATPWFPSLNDLVIRCAEIDKRRRKARELRMPVSMIVHCDGSGFTETVDGSVPCTRCNPYLAETFADHRAWKRLKTGTSLHLLNSQVQFIMGRMEAPESNPMPARCEIVEDPDAVFPTFAEGLEIAKRAYAEEAARAGKPINMKHFMTAMGANDAT